MTAQLLDALALFGVPAAVFLLAIGQFGVPLPTSLALLALGALAGNDDTDLASAFIWALAGATLGDQAGYAAGRLVIQSASDHTGVAGKFARKARQAEPHLRKWGGSSVFLSRWLFTPLGPPVNFASGATGFSWVSFTAWSVAGETLWVTIYIALGYIFGSNIETLAEILGNVSIALALIAIAAFLGWRLRLAVR